MSVWWKTDSISRHVTFELHNSSDVISINVLVERRRRQTEAPSEVRREFRVQPMRNTSVQLGRARIRQACTSVNMTLS